MKYILIAILLIVGAGLFAEWRANIEVNGTAAIDMNINTFKNQVINGANNLFINANTTIDFHVEDDLSISVHIHGDLANDADLEAIAVTVYNYFNNLLEDCEISIKYDIDILKQP